jgi:hypothetical protein
MKSFGMSLGLAKGGRLPHGSHADSQLAVRPIQRRAGGVISLTGHLFLALFPILICGCNSVRMTHGNPNLRQLEPAVYRSGQPAGNGEGFVYLHFIGITDIVKLDTEAEGSDNAAKMLGIQVHYFPITFRQQMGLDPIDLAAMDRLILSLPRYGVIVHCLHGEDRTGFFCARWRMLRDGWSKQAAENEMMNDNFHTSELGLYWLWQHQIK